MVEDVEGLKLELTFDGLCDVEVLEDRRIREVIGGATEVVATDVADGSKGRTGEGAGGGSIACEGRNRCEDAAAVGDGIEG